MSAINNLEKILNFTFLSKLAQYRTTKVFALCVNAKGPHFMLSSQRRLMKILKLEICDVGNYWQAPK